MNTGIKKAVAVVLLLIGVIGDAVIWLKYFDIRVLRDSLPFIVCILFSFGLYFSIPDHKEQNADIDEKK